DHCGPMARSVADAARLLQVIAGPSADYVRAVAEAPDDLPGVRIGAVGEGFDRVDADVAGAVHAAVERIGELGAEIRDVSLPQHAFAEAVTLGSSMEGMAMLGAGGGNGYHRGGEYWPELAAALNGGLRAAAQKLSPQMKLILVFGLHMQRAYLGEYYAKAQ